jgi:hypothetical protein
MYLTIGQRPHRRQILGRNLVADPEREQDLSHDDWRDIRTLRSGSASESSRPSEYDGADNTEPEPG